MKIESPAFKQGQTIPKKYTCEGQDVSPPLVISNIPQDAECLAIIVDDPDAPRGAFDHWIAWNIDPQTTSFPEGMRVDSQGTNGFGEVKYRGPCPPPGKPHRYFFKIYALDRMLELPEGSRKVELEKAMKGHILAQGEFFGIYQRS